MKLALLSTLLAASVLTGCASSSDEHKGKAAVAILNPTEGNQVHGRVAFTPVDKGVLIVAEVHGLTPGKHGFHIHEKADCSGDGMKTGGHFNPTGMPHAAPEAAKRHVGDLGNIEADENGDAFYERVDTVVQLTGENTIVGRPVVVHSGPDDLTSQPSGDAGSRISCGVIEWSDLKK